MDRDLRDRWIAALESGEYKKGTGFLCKQERFCCLGVLADLHDDLGPADELGRRPLISHPKNVACPPPDYHGLAERDMGILWHVNDYNDSFAPVVAKIRELFPDA